MSKVRVWDLPTRVFHWVLVLCFVGLLVTGEVGGNAMEWHFRVGYVVLTLLLFRLIWGIFGGFWSRFSSFVVAPTAIWRYAQGRGTPQQSIGHNPLGALSIVALLVFALLQVAAGLFSDDDIATSGPLAKMASASWVTFATYYHTKVGKIILIIWVQLHLAAIIFHRVRHRENLVLPMVSGDKEIAQPFESARDDTKSRAVALLVLALCASLVASLVRWAG